MSYLPDVDISKNPNTFNFCDAECKYLKNWNRNKFFFKTEKTYPFGQNPFMAQNMNTFIYLFIFFFAIEYEYNYPVEIWTSAQLIAFSSHMKANDFLLARIWDTFGQVI